MHTSELSVALVFLGGGIPIFLSWRKYHKEDLRSVLGTTLARFLASSRLDQVEHCNLLGRLVRLILGEVCFIAILLSLALYMWYVGVFPTIDLGADPSSFTVRVRTGTYPLCGSVRGNWEGKTLPFGGS